MLLANENVISLKVKKFSKLHQAVIKWTRGVKRFLSSVSKPNLFISGNFTHLLLFFSFEQSVNIFENYPKYIANLITKRCTQIWNFIWTPQNLTSEEFIFSKVQYIEHSISKKLNFNAVSSIAAKWISLF